MLLKLAPPLSESFEAQTTLLFTLTAASSRNTNGRTSFVQVVYSAGSGLLNLQHMTHNGEKNDRKFFSASYM